MQKVRRGPFTFTCPKCGRDDFTNLARMLKHFEQAHMGGIKVPKDSAIVVRKGEGLVCLSCHGADNECQHVQDTYIYLHDIGGIDQYILETPDPSDPSAVEEQYVVKIKRKIRQGARFLAKPDGTVTRADVRN